MMLESSRANKAEEFNQRVDTEFAKIQAGWGRNPETGEAIKSDRYFRVFPEELADNLNESVFSKILKEKIKPALDSEKSRQIEKELENLGSNLFGQYFLFGNSTSGLSENPFSVSNAANKVYCSQNEICSKDGSFEVEAEGFLSMFLDFAQDQKALSAETVDLLRKEGTEVVKGKKLRMSFNRLSPEELDKSKEDIRSNVWAYLGNSDWRKDDPNYLARGAEELIIQVPRPDEARPGKTTGVNVKTLSGKYSKLEKIELV